MNFCSGLVNLKCLVQQHYQFETCFLLFLIAILKNYVMQLKKLFKCILDNTFQYIFSGSVQRRSLQT